MPSSIERTIEQVRKGGLPPHVDERGQATLPNLFYVMVLETTRNSYFVAAFTLAGDSDSALTGRPSFTFTSRSILRRISGLSFNACFAFSLPCPSRSPL